MLILVLDVVLESADVLGIRNFDRKGESPFVALHNTVEFEGMRVWWGKRRR